LFEKYENRSKYRRGKVLIFLEHLSEGIRILYNSELHDLSCHLVLLESQNLGGQTGLDAWLGWGGDEGCIQNFGSEISQKMATWKTKTEMEETF